MSKIVVAALENCLGSAYLGVVDMLSLAGRAVARALGGEPPFYAVTASLDGQSIVDGAGRRFDVDTSFEEISACDAIIVPSFAPAADGGPPRTGAHAGVAAWLRRHHSRGAMVAGCGSGAFLLGEAGLLDGRRCTTSWQHFEAFKQRYPRADAAWGAPLIDDRRVVTSAGPLSWIETVLHAVRVVAGAEAARIAADYTLSEAAQAKGSALAPALQSTGTNSFLADAERIVRQAGAAPFAAHDLARALSTSERTLHRRLKLASGESPKSFIDRVRVETARTLLETSGKSVKELAGSAGFLDEASFRRAFRRFAGMAPSAYRVQARAKTQSKANVFAVRKESELIPELLTQILDSCVNGVTLADPDQPDSPIVYANAQFQKITGYGLDAILGRNCRFLQGEDREQEELSRLRDAIARRAPIEVTLRNYRADGSLFHNKLNITPLFDAEGRLIYFLGVQYNVSDQVRAETEIGDLRARLHALSPAELG